MKGPWETISPNIKVTSLCADMDRTFVEKVSVVVAQACRLLNVFHIDEHNSQIGITSCGIGCESERALVSYETRKRLFTRGSPFGWAGVSTYPHLNKNNNLFNNRIAIGD